jgi:hypothetical protein
MHLFQFVIQFLSLNIISIIYSGSGECFLRNWIGCSTTDIFALFIPRQKQNGNSRFVSGIFLRKEAAFPPSTKKPQSFKSFLNYLHYYSPPLRLMLLNIMTKYINCTEEGRANMLVKSAS